MNIPFPILLGIVIISLFVALAILQIAKKTVNKLRYSWQQAKIKRLITEVTYQLVNSKKFFTAVPIEVAKEVLSPNTKPVVEKHKAWSHHGDSTSFIIPTQNFSIPIAFSYFEKKFWISEVGGNYYFKDDSGLHILLEGKTRQAAVRLVSFCREFSLRCIAHRVRKIGRDVKVLERY